MARRIMVFAAAGVAICAYFIFFKERHDLIYLLSACLLILVVTYVFQYQIDQLMIRGVPQTLDGDMRQMLLATSKHFNEMPVPNKKMAEDRMVRWVMKKDFINKNEHDAPEDVRFMLAWYAIFLTMHQKTFLYDGVDRVVFYHHPFLSPGYPDDVHIAEVEKEDGTMIISVPHLIKGHMEKGMYNIALHAIAEAYAVCYMQEKISWPEDIWEQLESISTIPKSSIDAFIGLPVQDPWPVAVHHQLMYRNANIPEVLHELPQLLSAQSRP